MADDIDIEEHDVMDNPRIRKYFPDPTVIKLEPPDTEPEDEEFEECMDDNPVINRQSIQDLLTFEEPAVEYAQHNNVIILGTKPNQGTPTLAPNHCINLGNQQIFGTEPHKSFTEPNDGITNSFESQDDFEDESSQYQINDERHSSVFILGSKPNAEPNSDDLNTKDLDIQESSVVLEDWGPRLEASQCYCKDCEILFPTQNVLDAHNMTSHSFLIALEKTNKAVKSTTKAPFLKNTARKSTGFNYPSTSKVSFFNYNTLNEKYNVSLPKFRCDKCDYVSNSEIDLTAHMTNHTEVEDCTFYRCSICSCFFKWKKFFLIHLRKIHSVQEFKGSQVVFTNKCVYCTSTINSSIHYNRHIRKFHFNIYSKKLPDTNIKYKLQCSECNEVFLDSNAASHHKKTKHSQFNNQSLFNKIVIHKVLPPICAKKPSAPSELLKELSKPLAFKGISNLKRKIDDAAVVPHKKLKSENTSRKITLLYCAHCKCCMRSKRYIQLHLLGQCGKRGKKICKTCGLLTSTKRHDDLHEANRDLKLKDFEFIRIQDRKLIDPPIPPYPKCTKCGVNFCSENSLGQHECNDDHKTCAFCKTKFSDLAYKLHMAFHEYSNPKTSKIPKLKDHLVTTKITPKSLDMAELMKKYKSLKISWDILYLCMTCDIVCDSYDKAVEHSQNHFNNMESYGLTIKNCKICKLKFHDTCFDHHKELHSKNETIEKDSFKILKYDYQSLLSDDWFNLFELLPEAEVKHIISQSMYCFTRRVKMKVVKDGSPEFSIYLCGKCDRYVTPSTVSYHNELVSCSKERRVFKCQICKIKFASQKGQMVHQSIHIKNKDKTFRTVMFNDYGDEEFNKALKNGRGEANSSKLKKEKEVNSGRDSSGVGIGKKRRYDGNPKKIYHYQKCELCECCLKYGSKYRTHVCSIGNFKKKCPKCGLYFSNKKIKSHTMEHDRLPDFIRKNISITLFRPNVSGSVLSKEAVSPQKKIKQNNDDENRNDNEVAKIYKCQCGLHFISLKAIEKHFKVCNPDYKVSKENCSKCGLLFDTNVLFSHNCRHHGNDKYRRFQVVKVAFKDTLYKCGSCELLFYEQNELTSHFETCDVQSGRGNKCNYCGIAYRSPQTRHLLKQNKCTEKTENDYNIVTVNKPANEESNAANVNNFLYKCKKCNIYYMSRKSLTYHFNHNHELRRDQVSSCDVCGFKFSRISLKHHKRLHHLKFNYKRKDLHVIAADNKKDTSKTKSYVINKVKKYKEHFKKGSVMVKMPSSNYLYKCNDCDVHFVKESSFKRHTEDGIHTLMQKVKCKGCRLNFNPGCLSSHKNLHHKKNNLRAKDFRIISQTEGEDNYDVTETEDMVNQNIYKCVLCSLHFMKPNNYETHVSLDHENKNKIKCYLCGLVFSRKSYPRHKGLHHDKLNLKLIDFIILPVSDGSVSNVTEKEDSFALSESNNEIEDLDKKTNDTTIKSYKKKTARATKRSAVAYSDHLYKCNICNLHFIQENTVLGHMNQNAHANKKIKCTECGFFFSSMTLKRHVSIHHAEMKLNYEDFHIIAYTNVGDSYGSNCLYKCDLCGLHYLYQDSLVRGHVCGTDHNSYNSYVKSTCDICGLMISYNGLQRHKNIQHDKLKLNLQDFYIITMSQDGTIVDVSGKVLHENASLENEGLDTSVDLRTTTDVDTEKSLQIAVKAPVKKRKFGEYNLSKKNMTKLKLKFYSHCLYRCKCGLHFLNQKTYHSHWAREIRSKTHKTSSDICNICGLRFSLHTLGRHKYIHHIKMNLNVEDFDIRYYQNNKLNMQTSKIIKTINSDDTTQESVQKVIKTRKLSRTAMEIEYSNNLYKCDHCPGHFMKLSSLDKHRSKAKHDNNTKACEVCEYTFEESSLALHVLIHHKKMKLKREDLHIVTQPQPNVIQKAESPSTSSKSDINESVLNQSTDEIDTMNLADTETANTSNDTPANISPHYKTLYKCNTCALHVYHKNSLEWHMKALDHFSSERAECNICRLEFTTLALPKHKSYHHVKCKLKLDDFIIISQSPTNEDQDVDNALRSSTQVDTNVTGPSTHNDFDETSISQSTNSLNDTDFSIEDITKIATAKIDRKINLYKCSECNVYFLTQATCYKHSLKHKVLDPKSYINCKFCGFQFTVQSLGTHMRKHHATDFNLENVLVEEYQPNMQGKGLPKIDIYIAIDKVQSKIVSTTTDKEADPISKEFNEVNTNASGSSASIDEKNDIVCESTEQIDNTKEVTVITGNSVVNNGHCNINLLPESIIESNKESFTMNVSVTHDLTDEKLEGTENCHVTDSNTKGSDKNILNTNADVTTDNIQTTMTSETQYENKTVTKVIQKELTVENKIISEDDIKNDEILDESTQRIDEIITMGNEILNSEDVKVTFNLVDSTRELNNDISTEVVIEKDENIIDVT